MTDMRNALKALGAVLAVIALCAPLMFLPVEDTEPGLLRYAGVTVTVPATTVVVATTIPGLETTTTTTEAPAPPPPEPSISTTTTTAPIRATIAAVGDVRVSPDILLSALDPASGSYDFAPILAPIAPYLEKADYAVAALEPRLAGPEPGYASGPKPNAPRELAFALKDAGVDLVATANPHSLALGWEGLVGTLDRLDAAGLAHVGTSRTNSERQAPVIADVKGIRVAFLDYTAAVTGSLPAEEKKDYAVSMLDLGTISQDAMTARTWGADVVVALVDYCTEYQQKPSDEQIALSQEVLDHAGVDVILGCQAPVIQTIGHRVTFAGWRVNDKYVAYSLGDFLRGEEPQAASGVTPTIGAPSSSGTTAGGTAAASGTATSSPTAGSPGPTTTTSATPTTNVTPAAGSTSTTSAGPAGSTTTDTTLAGETPRGSGMIVYLHLEKWGLRTYVTGVSYLPVYMQATPGEQMTTAGGPTTTTTTTNEPAGGGQAKSIYRILPVLPGLEPDSDVALTSEDRTRMAEIWEHAWSTVYRPDENITPLSPRDLGL